MAWLDALGRAEPPWDFRAFLICQQGFPDWMDDLQWRGLVAGSQTIGPVVPRPRGLSRYFSSCIRLPSFPTVENHPVVKLIIV